MVLRQKWANLLLK